jgi:3-phosphoshikimate 1-carboxyvinyltransferase
MQVLQKHGIKIANQSYKVFEIKGNQSYQGAHHITEGDWSNAAFLLVAGAINGNIELAGLHAESAQGDRMITKVLEKCGALINQKAELWHAKATPSLKAFEWDATDTPDLFPPLACLAAYCEGTSRIKGVNRLIHKESNRAEALITEFGKQGIDISQEEDYLVIKGGIPQGGPFHSHNDHRIAMAGAILALKSKAPVQMTGHEAVHKSYPGFFEDLRKLQVKTEENE